MTERVPVPALRVGLLEALGERGGRARAGELTRQLGANLNAVRADLMALERLGVGVWEREGGEAWFRVRRQALAPLRGEVCVVYDWIWNVWSGGGLRGVSRSLVIRELVGQVEMVRDALLALERTGWLTRVRGEVVPSVAAVAYYYLDGVTPLEVEAW